jgi:hypothetical protein
LLLMGCWLGYFEFEGPEDLPCSQRACLALFAPYTLRPPAGFECCRRAAHEMQSNVIRNTCLDVVVRTGCHNVPGCPSSPATEGNGRATAPSQPARSAVHRRCSHPHVRARAQTRTRARPHTHTHTPHMCAPTNTHANTLPRAHTHAYAIACANTRNTPTPMGTRGNRVGSRRGHTRRRHAVVVGSRATPTPRTEAGGPTRMYAPEPRTPPTPRRDRAPPLGPQLSWAGHHAAAQPRRRTRDTGDAGITRGVITHSVAAKRKPLAHGGGPTAWCTVSVCGCVRTDAHTHPHGAHRLLAYDSMARLPAHAALTRTAPEHCSVSSAPWASSSSTDAAWPLQAASHSAFTR